MIIKFSSPYSRRSGLPIEDLRSECVLALVECVQKFDQTKENASFQAMAFTAMLRRVQDYTLKQSGVASRPLSKPQLHLRTKLGSLVKDFVASGMSKNQALRESAKVLNVTELDVLAITNDTFSTVIDETFEITENGQQEEEINKHQTKRIVESALDCLTEREKQIVSMRFLYEKPSSYEQISLTINGNKNARAAISEELQTHILPKLLSHLQESGLTIDDVIDH